MFSVTVNDDLSVSYIDIDSELSIIAVCNFETCTIEHFYIAYIGDVTSLSLGEDGFSLWAISDCKLYFVDLRDCIARELGKPDRNVFFYSVIGQEKSAMACARYMTVWMYELEGSKWVPISVPPGKPERTGDDDADTRNNRKYATEYPSVYGTFSDSDAVYFYGARGTLLRYRDGEFSKQNIATESRLVVGQIEDGAIVLGADSPTGQIYKGSFDSGFECIYEDGLRAFHRTAFHGGVQYLGVSSYPYSETHCLYVIKDEEVVPEFTGCLTEPGPLIGLCSSNAVLWAVDEGGVFRKGPEGWVYVNHQNILDKKWP